jgi:hypothetical protein
VPTPEAIAQKAFLGACEEFVNGGEPFRILKEMTEDADPRVRGWAVEKLLQYGVGTPTQRKDRAEVSLEDAARAALARILASRTQGLDPEGNPFKPPPGSLGRPIGLISEGRPEDAMASPAPAAPVEAQIDVEPGKSDPAHGRGRN